MIGLLRAVLVAVALSGGSAFAVEEAPAPRRVPTPEEIAGWLKVFEQYTDPRATDDYVQRVKAGEKLTLWRTLTEDRMIDYLLNTKNKSIGRTFICIKIAWWLRGEGASEPVNHKLLDVVITAMKDRDPEVRSGMLAGVSACGKYAAMQNDEFGKKLIASDPFIFKGKPIRPLEKNHGSDALQMALLPHIIESLKDENEAVVHAAAKAVWAFGIPNRGVKELVAALRRVENGRVRYDIVKALSVVGVTDATAAAAVVEELKDRKPYGDSQSLLYSMLIETAGKFGPLLKDAKPVLLSLIAEERWPDFLKSGTAADEAQAAVCALGHLGTHAKELIPHLFKLFEVRCLTNRWIDEIAIAIEKIEPESGMKARELRLKVLAANREQLNGKQE